MNRSEIALEILKKLIDKSGVQEWNEPEKRILMVAAANEMADAICGDDCEMATSKQYAISETTKIWGSEVGDDLAWSTEAIANAAGRQGTLYDMGAGTTARSDRFHFYFKMDGWQATPTIGATLDLHIKTSDGTTPDNDDGTTDAAVSTEDKLKNLDYLDEIVCDEAAANILGATSGYAYIPQRHVAPVMWNRGGSATKNAEAGIKFYLTPRPLQQQAT